MFGEAEGGAHDIADYRPAPVQLFPLVGRQRELQDVVRRV